MGSIVGMHHRFPFMLAGLAFCMLTSIPAKGAVDFEKEIRPIFEQHCVDCHGPEKQKSDLRVDQRAAMLKGGDGGFPALVPGNPKASFLLEAISGKDPDVIMPPKGDPLNKDQIALIEKWIEEGAVWPGQMNAKVDQTVDLWSFQPVERPDIPHEIQSPIDVLLNTKLREKGLKPNDTADAQTLIRRASIVLTGLPPIPERSAEFVADYAKSPDAAYAALIDELLASPHFGERWAQHWLDAIRWAETNGSESNLYRKNAWVYRDYVMRAFNEDIPYDRFVTEQIAGDQFGVGEATGFLVAGPHVPAATVGQEATAIRQARADRMDEIMQTIGASILGVSVGCARCHNHKFDPISLKDYYAMTGIFQGVEFGGRPPEYHGQHPVQQRADEIQSEMTKARSVLAENGGVWIENWGGFHDLNFPVVTTKALRVEFLWNSVGVDELQVYGPGDFNKNLALASTGTILKTDDGMTQLRGELHKANDGKFGTEAWRSKASKGSKIKPWVEIHFTQPYKVQKFRMSTNREYYFETDYLDRKVGSMFPGHRVLAMQENGDWKPVGGVPAATQLLKKTVMKEASDRLQDLIASMQKEGPVHSFVGRFIEPVTTHILQRGSPENPRDEVRPAAFSALDGDLGLDLNAPEPNRRMRFTRWLTDPKNPLTARVMVNRLWHHVFGAGIVTTTSDFGSAGARPTHPALLDWLAAEMIEPTQTEAAPWSMKGMIRLMVMSDAFRRSSLPNKDNLLSDANATMLWRYPPRRVEAEVIRDGILQASGKLDTTLGGKSYRIHNVKKTYAQWEVVDNHGPSTWRRMIYQERMRRVDDQIFTAFDFPDCGQVRAKRPVSTTPLQALNLMNSDFVVEQADYIAERAKADTENADMEMTVRRCFSLLLTRQPETDELNAATKIAKNQGLHVVCRSLMNSNEFAFIR